MIAVTLLSENGRQKVMFPESWNELTPMQARWVAHILFSAHPAEMQLTEIVVALSGMSTFIRNQVSAEVMRDQLFPLVSWVQEGELLTKQLFPTIRLGGGTVLYGPSDELGNIRLVEFDFAERELFYWNEAPDNIQLLYNFVACLYRPAVQEYDFEHDPDGDCRQPFNYNISLKLAKRLKTLLPLDTALAIVLWYKGCRHKITQDHPRIFDGGGNDIYAPEAPVYYGLMRSIAKTGIYGNFEAVEQMFLANALIEMELVLDERDEIEKMKNQNKEQ